MASHDWGVAYLGIKVGGNSSFRQHAAKDILELSVLGQRKSAFRFKSLQTWDPKPAKMISPSLAILADLLDP